MSNPPYGVDRTVKRSPAPAPYGTDQGNYRDQGYSQAAPSGYQQQAPMEQSRRGYQQPPPMEQSRRGYTPGPGAQRPGTQQGYGHAPMEQSRRGYQQPPPMEQSRRGYTPGPGAQRPGTQQGYGQPPAAEYRGSTTAAGGSRAPGNAYGAMDASRRRNGGAGGPPIQNGTYGLNGEPMPEHFVVGSKGEFAGKVAMQPPGGKSSIIFG